MASQKSPCKWNSSDSEMAQFQFNFINGVQGAVWLEEQERVPLKQRLKLLLASHRISYDDSDVKLEAQVPANGGATVAERTGNESCNLQFSCSPEEQRLEIISREERHAENLGVSDEQENLVNNCMSSSQTIAAAAPSREVNSVDSNLFHQLLLSPQLVNIKVEPNDDCVESSSGNLNGPGGADIMAVNTKPEISIESLDELDHVSLKERLERLLTSKSLGLMASKLEDESSGILPLVSGTSHSQADGTEKREQRIGDQRLSGNGNQIYGFEKTLTSVLSKSPTNSSCTRHQVVGHCSGVKRSNSTEQGIQGNHWSNSSEEDGSKYESNSGNTLVSADNRTVQCSATLKFSEVKVEPPTSIEVQSSTAFKLGPMSFLNFPPLPIKTEVQFASESDKDELDHMSLTERMKLLPSRGNPSLNILQSSECMNKRVPPAFGSSPAASRPAVLKVNRPRKRRKTVTDSVEIAMEEDAPGLLQVLIDKGVSVNEIKLYGEPESDDVVDDSSPDDNFVELEAVITKLFSQRESFLKFGPLRCSKGEKASYCLECLFSLVEQARYLQFRNWPVEWGWCRDLQSFIFVFERHNRIVLERPEYGYATYFFELADSLPIVWQVKRLVTAMKLTSCSRITLIENKALMVGDDLTEGEARVLMEYGWIPNTGLGTMLNYYDRVVHDRKNEKERSEWRSKIGKLLMEGYNGGTLVSADIPRKVMEYNVAHPVEVKLELN